MEIFTPTNALLTVVMLLVGVVGYLLRDKLTVLAESDGRLEDKVDKVNAKVVSIDRRISRVEGKLGIGFSSGASPLKLTPLGEGVLNESGIKEWVDAAKPQLLDALKEMKEKGTIKSAYDVQEGARQIIETSLFYADWEKRFKDYAFQKGIDLGIVRQVGALYFRDVALQELGISSEDLDKK